MLIRTTAAISLAFTASLAVAAQDPPAGEAPPARPPVLADDPHPQQDPQQEPQQKSPDGITPTAAIEIPRSRDSGPAVPLLLQDAMMLGARNNSTLRANELLAYMAAEDVRQAQGVFDPEFFADTTISSDRSPARNIFQPSLTRESYNARFGIRQLMPTGGLFDIAYGGTALHQTTNAPGFPPEQFTSDIEVNLTQPLLRGAWSEYVLKDIHEREALRAASASRHRRVVQNTLFDIVRAYWDLVFVRENYRVAYQALELAETQLVRTDKQIQAGELAARDRIADEAEVARRKEELVTAENDIHRAADVLRRLVFDDGEGQLWTRDLLPITPIGKVPPPTDVDWRQPARLALRHRPDLSALRAEVAAAEIRKTAAAQEVLPRLDLVGSYLSDSARSTYRQAWEDSINFTYPDWSVRLELSVPIGNNAAVAFRERTRIDLERIRRNLYDAEIEVSLEVRNAVRELRRLTESVQRGEESRRLAESNLRREIDLKDVGASTSFEVTRRNQELQEARSRLLRNQLDYRIAEAELLYVEGLLAVPGERPSTQRRPGDGGAARN